MKKITNNKIVKYILIILILSLNIYTLFFYISKRKDENKTNDIINKINNTDTQLNQNDMIPNTKSENEIIKEKIINSKNINNDTIGWINVNNTDIDYPFVIGQDNEYYLNHTLDRARNVSGWVFLDHINNPYMTSKASILYAHNLTNGTMFGSLKNLLKNKENNYIYIYTLDKKLTYQVFSTYTVKKETYYLTKHFKNNEDFLNFTNTLKKRSNYNYNVSIKEDDRILTLSTCSGLTNRLAVHSVLINEEKI